MVKSNAISAMKANRLYWLGRYEERVYMTLHLLRQCYDRMIDGDTADYEEFWQKLDASGSYSSPDEFRLGMLYDTKNPNSIISEINFAKDNAILLREDITSETLSFIEMSIAHMNKCKAEVETNITTLQPITDWSLAFWGSVFQRLHNPKIISLIVIGRNVEYMDMLIRFGYPFDRIRQSYEEVKAYGKDVKRIFDTVIESQLDYLLTAEQYNPSDMEYRNKVLKFINQLVLV